MSELDQLFGEVVEVTAFPEREQLWAALPGGGGAYAFCDADDRLILLASAQSLRRSIRHRLSDRPADTTPSKRADLASITRRVRWCPTHSLFEAALVYYRLARVLYPKDYRRMIAFGPAWFIHLDPQSPWPRFVATNRIYQQPGCYWGPYPTRAAAGEVIAGLEDLFDLCRYHDLLDKSPHGQACAYYEMNKCPAPCDGSLAGDLYKAQNVEPARAFLWGRREEQIARWRRAMEAAAKELAFERAAVLKSRIERGQQPLPGKHTPAGDAADFDYLVVQRAGGTSWVKPFFVTGGRIETGQPVRIKTLPEIIESWLGALAAQRAQGPGPLDPVQQSEQVWLICRFLFKGDTAPGCFLHRNDLDPPAHALRRLADTFARPRRAAGAKLAGQVSAANMPAGGAAPAANKPDVPEDNTENPEPHE